MLDIDSIKHLGARHALIPAQLSRLAGSISTQHMQQHGPSVRSHLREELGRHAVEVDANAQWQSPPVLKSCEALVGHLLADDVDGGEARLLKQLADVELHQYMCRMYSNVSGVGASLTGQ